jgi:hypothetical protein
LFHCFSLASSLHPFFTYIPLNIGIKVGGTAGRSVKEMVLYQQYNNQQSKEKRRMKIWLARLSRKKNKKQSLATPRHLSRLQWVFPLVHP